MISREYAEFIAARFDSLDAYKIAYGECVDRAVECDALLNKSERLIADLNEQNANYSDMLQIKSDIIASYERGTVVCNDYARQLKKEKRLKKVWKITSYAFISVSLGALTYSIFK